MSLPQNQQRYQQWRRLYFHISKTTNAAAATTISLLLSLLRLQKISLSSMLLSSSSSLLLLFLLLLILIFSQHHSAAAAAAAFSITRESENCITRKMDQSIEVSCSNIPVATDFLTFPLKTSILLIACNSKSQTSTSQSFDSFQPSRLPYLLSFSIKNCPVSKMSSSFFRNMIYLEQVTFENLPIVEAPEHLFKNSSNLKEIYLINLPNLRRLHPRFMDNQNRLNQIFIFGTSISSHYFKPIIKTLYSTIDKVTWTDSKTELKFSEFYFKHFFFNILKLDNNNIRSTKFLRNVKTKHLSLKSNPIRQNLQFHEYSGLREHIQILNLDSISYAGKFPNTNFDILMPQLRELIISNNKITSLSENLVNIMPQLQLLDIRNNNIRTISKTIQFIFDNKQFDKLLATGNPIHCNCELLWVAVKYAQHTRSIECATLATSNGSTATSGSLMSHQNNLVCVAPKVDLMIVEKFSSLSLVRKVHKHNLIIYQMELFGKEVISGKCISTGDPTPNLTWIMNEQVILKVTQTPVTSKTYAIMDIFISKDVLDKGLVEGKFITFKCRAESQFGVADAVLNITILNNATSQSGLQYSQARVNKVLSKPLKKLSSELRCDIYFIFMLLLFVLF